MAKHYPQTLWDAIRAYWENSNASFLEAAKAVCKGEDIPSKPVIFKRAQKENWQKKGNAKVTVGNGNEDALPTEQTIDDINKSVRKKADLLGIKGNADSKVGNGLSDVILNNIHLSPEQIDDLCEDYRASVLQNHRIDFDQLNAVVNKCIELFRKAIDLILEGCIAVDGDIVDPKTGFVHEGMARSLLTAEFSIKAMLNAATVKNIIQTNQRKSYSLETYEEPNSTGNLAQKALSSKGMGNHYERIRLSKKDERERMKDKLKGIA